MSQRRQFVSQRVARFPSEYEFIMDLLKGKDANGQSSHPPLIRYNTTGMILAASVGLLHGRRAELGADKTEVPLEFFESHRLGTSQTTLSTAILLIALLDTQDVELLRPEREADILRAFEKLVAGGFSFLRAALSRSTDVTGYGVIREEVERALRATELQI
jgi:hypothetical protein